MGDRRLRQNAVAEIEDMGAAGETVEHPRDRLRRARARRRRAPAGRDCLAARCRPGSIAAAALGSAAVSSPIAASPSTSANLPSWVAAPRGKAMIGIVGMPAPCSRGDDARERRHAPALEFGAAAARPTRNRRSAPPRRPPRSGEPDSRRRHRRADRSAPRTVRARDRRRAAPAPGRACPRPAIM